MYSISPALDGGLSFDPSTRKIAGTPHAVNHGSLHRYIVSDAAGSTASFEFRIFVRPTPYNVANEDLVSLLPPNATDFEKAIEAMISQNILPIDDNGHARMPILDAWNPDALPEHLLPFLGLNLSLIIDASLPVDGTTGFNKERIQPPQHRRHTAVASQRHLRVGAYRCIDCGRCNRWTRAQALDILQHPTQREHTDSGGQILDSVDSDISHRRGAN